MQCEDWLKPNLNIQDRHMCSGEPWWGSEYRNDYSTELGLEVEEEEGGGGGWWRWWRRMVELSAQESTKMEATGTSRSRRFFPVVPAPLHRSLSQHFTVGCCRTSHKAWAPHAFTVPKGESGRRKRCPKTSFFVKNIDLICLCSGADSLVIIQRSNPNPEGQVDGLSVHCSPAQL